ncbi:hypothetical protein PIB30_086318 [Stylosanthes scabra]|uniref:Cytochrome P450 n=1 Tax=Stylosanthes scabra TaxID=79078 RepID=A0ABU6ZRP1_9FABA|nr:hypothetical protein [Stylosanthes scabra]
MDFAHYTSHKSQEFKDIIWGAMEEAGRPNVMDFFPIFRLLDPQDKTSSTIEWAMAELLHNPKNLVIVREELAQLLAKGEKQLEESLISRLPFLRAIVKETLRLHPPAPFLLPHRPENDVEVCGYLVPKDAQILTNVWAMGRDSSIWTNPNEFMPERFLESEIDFKGQDFELIPFGAGRRICPGVALGFRIIHFVLASLLFEYDWKLPNKVNSEEMDMSEKFGLTLHKAQPLQVIPISMHNNNFK